MLLDQDIRACERCASEKRKTINGDDILYAMRTLGFEKYAENLEIYLKKFRDVCDEDGLFT